MKVNHGEGKNVSVRMMESEKSESLKLKAMRDQRALEVDFRIG